MILEKQEPQYSEEARIAKLEGVVVLSLIVSADGHTRDLRILRPLGLGLDEMAIKAVSAWRFKPALKEGNPVAVISTVEVRFHLLLDSRAWRLEGGSCAGREGGPRPVLISAKYPRLAGSGEAEVTVSFDVDENGHPRNVQTVRSSDPKWAADVTHFLRSGWRFGPGSKDGKPVPGGCWWNFARGRRSTAPQPVLIYKVEPTYSQEAPQAKYGGTVLLSVVVDEDGVPREIRVLRPLGTGLDERAIEAVKKWRFLPATKDLKPIPSTTRVEVDFRIPDRK